MSQIGARSTALIEILLDGKASTIFEAIGILDNLPRVNDPATWEKIADRFARLKPTDQSAFFTLHEAAVLRWIAERKAAY